MSGINPYLTDMIACVLKLNHVSVGESLLVFTLVDHLYPFASIWFSIGSPSPVGLAKTPSTLDASVGSFMIIGTFSSLG